jgi:EAL and modified HD-GYP domain-containing signal transduction protein
MWLKTMALGFTYFQGFFFARPMTLTGKKTDPLRQALTGILSLVLSEAETEEIIGAIRPHVDLVSSLLRVANVVGLSPGRTVTDLRQALLVMGRDQLKRWVELLLFSSAPTENRYARPLFLLAIVRGRLMERLAPLWQGSGKPLPDHAFLTGLFSLAEPLLGIPLGELLEGLPLDRSIKNALNTGEGNLGTLLSVVRRLAPASPEEEVFAALPFDAPLPLEAIAEVQAEAQVWADETLRALA